MAISSKTNNMLTDSAPKTKKIDVVKPGLAKNTKNTNVMVTDSGTGTPGTKVYPNGYTPSQPTNPSVPDTTDSAAKAIVNDVVRAASTRGIGSGSSGGYSGGSSEAAAVVDPTASVRNTYNTLLQQLAADNERALGVLANNYNESRNTLNPQYDLQAQQQNQSAADALREAYINYMMSRKNATDDMYRQGYTGGLTESNLARMYNNYGNIRNSINTALASKIMENDTNRNAALSSLLQNYNTNRARQEEDYFGKKTNYQQALQNALMRLA